MPFILRHGEAVACKPPHLVVLRSSDLEDSKNENKSHRHYPQLEQHAVMTETFSSRELFGGAITVSLPTDFIDARYALLFLRLSISCIKTSLKKKKPSSQPLRAHFRSMVLGPYFRFVLPPAFHAPMTPTPSLLSYPVSRLLIILHPNPSVQHHPPRPQPPRSLPLAHLSHLAHHRDHRSDPASAVRPPLFPLR